VTTSNPWLNIPPDDYETHMSSKNVQQYGTLSELFGEAPALCRPESVAVLGLAGGNGLERLDRNVTQRIIGIDDQPGLSGSERTDQEKTDALRLAAGDGA
jgi:hypothetical protein